MAEKILSIFVDESGDFGEYQSHCPYYVVSMVFHEQQNDISSAISRLNTHLRYYNLQDYAIHTAPLIRREEIYETMTPNERRRIFMILQHFACESPITYKVFVYAKKNYDTVEKLEAGMTRDMEMFFGDSLAYFQNFDSVVLYYDNGQHELNRILNDVLKATVSRYEERKVMPNEYKLFQVADLICTLELLSQKIETRDLTRSESLIFHSKRDLKKDFLKGIRKKAFKAS